MQQAAALIAAAAQHAVHLMKLMDLTFEHCLALTLLQLLLRL